MTRTLDTEPEWIFSDTPVAYPEAVRFMEDRVADIYRKQAREGIWLLEHPAIYTAGSSADPTDLKAPDRFPVFQSGRGGQYTYHGPGQRIAYVMLDLGQRGRDVRAFVHALEDWVIQTLWKFNITGERRDGRVGIWVDQGHGREAKIAAIGVRLRKWVSYHGISINVDPELDHFNGIVPCGISEHGVTSLLDLGVTATVTDLDNALMETFPTVFGKPLRSVLHEPDPFDI
ncbi:MAG: lipoyl(octanoyl) transferase LipB [Rhodospirillales bacterium]